MEPFRNTFRAMLVVGFLVIATGCSPAVPKTEIKGQISRASGLDQPIVFQIEGESVDTPDEGSSHLSLAHAVQRTLAHDPKIQAALSRLRIALADARQVRLLPNPVVSVVFRFPEGGGSTTIEAGLAADLVALLSRPGQAKAADQRLRSAAAEALSQVLDTLVEVREKYVAVQTLEELSSVLDERMQIIDRLLDLARSRLEFGEGTRLDVLTLETQRIELETEIAETRLNLREQRLALTRLIGQPSAKADWPVDRWEGATLPSIPESTWISAALENRPEVQARRYELAALGFDRSLTRFAPFDGAEVGVEAERDGGDWSLDPALSTPIPIFDTGKVRRARAQAAVIEARHKLTEARRQVVQDTRQSHASFVASSENLRRVRDHLIPVSERRLEQAEAQFRGGQVDVTQLLLAEQELRTARTRLVELQRRSTEALIRLQRAVGGAGIVAALSNGTSTTNPATNPATQSTRGTLHESD